MRLRLVNFWVTLYLAAWPLFTIAVAESSLGTQANPHPDIVLTNALLIDASSLRNNNRVNVMIKDGKIIAKILPEFFPDAFIGPKTEVIDATHYFILPGFVEAHGHLMHLGRSLSTIDLTQKKSYAEIAETVGKAVQSTPQGQWVRGDGWDQNLWLNPGLLDRKELDAITTEHPIALTRIDGHAMWLNSKALTLVSITESTRSPAGGSILKGHDGRPNGILIGNAMHLVRKVTQKANLTQRTRWIKNAIRHLHQLGITTFHDAGTSFADLEAIKLLHQNKQLQLRIYAMLASDDRHYLESHFQKGPTLTPDHKLTIRSIKLMADSAPDSEDALALAFYNNRKHHHNVMMSSTVDIEAIATRASHAGFQVATQAVGYKANRVVLDAYERLSRQFSDKDLRLRVEHAQLLDDGDIRRFTQHNIIASMQPSHALYHPPWATTKIHPDSRTGTKPVWQTLSRHKALLAFGSNAPVESPNPFLGINAALSGQHRDTLPHESWHLSHELNLQQSLHGYTVGGAYAAFQEHLIGQLKTGYLADMIFLKADPRSLKPRDWLHVLPVMTMVHGKVVYRKKHTNRTKQKISHL